MTAVPIECIGDVLRDAGRQPIPEFLERLRHALLRSELWLPVDDAASGPDGATAFRCRRLDDGRGVIPAYCSQDRLSEAFTDWTAVGVPGFDVYPMIADIPEIDLLGINDACADDTPKLYADRKLIEYLAAQHALDAPALTDVTFSIWNGEEWCGVSAEADAA